MSVTFTNIAYDIRAKLMLFSLLAGTWWAVHSAAAPFDNRQNSTLDKMESLGLRTRFFTFSLIQFMLMFDAPAFITWTVAGILLSANAYFVHNELQKALLVTLLHATLALLHSVRHTIPMLTTLDNSSGHFQALVKGGGSSLRLCS